MPRVYLPYLSRLKTAVHRRTVGNAAVIVPVVEILIENRDVALYFLPGNVCHVPLAVKPADLYSVAAESRLTDTPSGFSQAERLYPSAGGSKR